MVSINRYLYSALPLSNFFKFHTAFALEKREINVPKSMSRMLSYFALNGFILEEICEIEHSHFKTLALS